MPLPIFMGLLLVPSATKMAAFFRSIDASPGLVHAYALVAQDGCVAGDMLPAVVLDDSPPVPEPVDDAAAVSDSLDFFHRRLTGVFSEPDADAPPELDEDLDFVAEGRKLLAIRNAFVLPAAMSEHAVAEFLVRQVGCLVTSGVEDASMVILPGFEADVASFVHDYLRAPLPWLGLDDLVEVEGHRNEEGAPIVRLFARLSTVPGPTKVSVRRITTRELVEGYRQDAAD